MIHVAQQLGSCDHLNMFLCKQSIFFIRLDRNSYILVDLVAKWTIPKYLQVNVSLNWHHGDSEHVNVEA